MKTTVHYVRPLSLALLTALSITFSGSVFAVAGKFQFVNGEVQVIDTAGKPRLAQKGGAIDEGETVSSSGNGFAQIKMEDGGFFAVRPDTEFKVDTFQFNGKEDGSEKGVFSLIKGSLRSVTGLIGKKHKDNYKIQTATSTIGIRGSGADVGHNNSIGTAVRTLFGGHSLTSGGKTIFTGPGQTALAPPGQEPRFVPGFPFNTGTGVGGQNKGNSDKSGDGSSDKKSTENKEKNNAPVAEQHVVIPVKSADGEVDFTKLTNNDAPFGNDVIPGVPAPLGSGGSTAALVTYTYPGYAAFTVGENNFDVVNGTNFSAYTDASGSLVGWKSTFSDPFFSSKSIVKLGSATLTVDGTEVVDGVANAVVWGRWGAGYTVMNTETHGGVTTTQNVQPVGGLVFITGAHMTTMAELGNAASWTPGPGLNQSVMVTGTYELAAGSFPTLVNGLPSGTITGAGATVNFTNNQITAIYAMGAGGAFGNWLAQSAGPSSITATNGAANFNVPLTGTCINGSGSCAGAMAIPITGNINGGFVGAQAPVITGTVGLRAAAGDRLGGAVNMHRQSGCGGAYAC